MIMNVSCSKHILICIYSPYFRPDEQTTKLILNWTKLRYTIAIWWARSVALMDCCRYHYRYGYVWASRAAVADRLADFVLMYVCQIRNRNDIFYFRTIPPPPRRRQSRVCCRYILCTWLSAPNNGCGVDISLHICIFLWNEMIRKRESNINFILKNFLSLVFFPKCGGHTCDPILLFLVVYTIAAQAVSKFRFLR